MKQKLILLTICLWAALYAMAQTQSPTQQGYVRTAERPKRPSQGIKDAVITIKGRGDVKSKKDGSFSFPFNNKNKQEGFKVLRIQKKGYTLVDKQLIGRKYAYSTSVPIVVVMQSEKQVAQDKKEIEDKGFAKATKKYEARIAELERQYQEKIISEHEKEELSEQASYDFEQFIQMLDEPDRTIVRMQLEGYSYEEIGKAVSMTEKNISVRLIRIKEKLRKKMTI